MTANLILLLSSAAVGALVSSAITLVGQHIERKARREELLLTEAIKMAGDHRSGLMKLAEARPNTGVFVPNQIRLTVTYLIGLKSLIGSGRLPKGMFSDESTEDNEEFLRRHGY